MPDVRHLYVHTRRLGITLEAIERASQERYSDPGIEDLAEDLRLIEQVVKDARRALGDLTLAIGEVGG